MTVYPARFYTFSPLLLSLFLGNSFCATLEEWRSRSIYQVLTDRFAHANASASPACNVEAGLYCGGSWQGIKAQLDYIQGMNFDAIWISPVVANLPQNTADGEAYAGYWGQGKAEAYNPLISRPGADCATLLMQTSTASIRILEVRRTCMT